MLSMNAAVWKGGLEMMRCELLLGPRVSVEETK